jgi:uncharacterized membrane protein
MKRASQIILIVAIACIIYGYWGAFTQSGNKVYDEMDAMLPFFVLLLGVVLLLVFLVLVFILKRKSKSGNRKRNVINLTWLKDTSLADLMLLLTSLQQIAPW